MTGPSDEPGDVRPGEELDVAALSRWLGRIGLVFAGPLEVRQFRGGHSNLTYLLRAGDRELVLRRPPFGSQVQTAHDMTREHRILSRLPDVWPKAPRALALCDDGEILGAPFYLMERVDGVILRRQGAPDGAPLARETMQTLSESLVDTLVELHAVDYHAAGLSELGRPDGYAARQIRGWTERYARARTDDLPEVEKAARWLLEQTPRGANACLIHNDYKYDNLVLARNDPTRIVGVLDWEMATLGDPLMDLGTTLGYWVDEDDDPAMRLLPVGPTTLAGNLRRAEVAERYARQTGADLAQLVFYYVYGLFKIAVIAQQIYSRYAAGLTQDARFGLMIEGVRLLGRAASQAIDKGRIDRLG